MPYHEAERDDPDALEIARGCNIVFSALQDGEIDPDLLHSIFVRCMMLELTTRRGASLADKLARIDEMAAYMRAAVSANHMVTEFFGSER